MADQFAYANMQQAGQAAAFSQFHYPNAGGDQNAQLLQGYAIPHQGNAATGSMYGGQASAAYNFDQSGTGYSHSPSVPGCQVEGGSQVSMQPGGGGFAYSNYNGSFNQYAGMNQGLPHNISAMQAGFGGDIQQFNPLMANAFRQTMSANGAILEAIAHEQGFNPIAFLQDPANNAARGNISGRGTSQRGGYSKFGAPRTGTNLPSVANPDGLRENTIFVANLPQNVDHDAMKSHFGSIGKIKINSKSGMPMIWIFKEKGIPKGEALVTFEDPKCVQSAIQWFKDNEFLGKKIDVRQATNSQRPVIIPPGGANANGQANPAAALAVAAVAAAASGNTISSLMNNSAAAAASLSALTGINPTPVHQIDPKDFAMARGASAQNRGRLPMSNGNNGRSSVGSVQAGSREGDWSCVNCGNINFSWREQCNRCQSIRVDDDPINGEMSMNRGNFNMMDRNNVQMPIGVLNSNQQAQMPGFGRGIPMNPSGTNRGRGGGPMRGSSVGVGRARPAPY